MPHCNTLFIEISVSPHEISPCHSFVLVGLRHFGRVKDSVTSFRSTVTKHIVTSNSSTICDILSVDMGFHQSIIYQYKPGFEPSFI